MPFHSPIPIPFPESIFGKLKLVIDSRHWDPALCWEWPGARNTKGYGVITHWDNIAHKQWQVVAHRAAYCFHHEIVNTGDLLVLHHCDNPPCWNWDHLFLGTTQDNTADMVEKGRNSFKTIGRPFDLNPALIDTVRGERNRHAKLTTEQVVDIRTAYEAGASTGLLARKYGLSLSAMLRIAKGEGWAHVKTPALVRVPKAGGKSVLTEWDVIAIRLSLSAGMKVPELARRFGVSPYTLYSLASGKSWKSLL